MPESTNLDGYLYFVGEGKYGKDLKKYLGMIKGETPDKRFQKHGAFKIWSFNWESNHVAASHSDETLTKDSSDSGNDKPEKRPKFSPMMRHQDAQVSVGAFTVTKDIDLATPTLFLAHAHCAVFKGAHVYFRKMASGKFMTFFRASFSDVIVQKWQCDFGGDAKETLAISFNWCQITYYPQSKEGTSKKHVANMKQFCTSNPEPDEAPPDHFKTDVDDSREFEPG